MNRRDMLKSTLLAGVTIGVGMPTLAKALEDEQPALPPVPDGTYVSDHHYVSRYVHHNFDRARHFVFFGGSGDQLYLVGEADLDTRIIECIAIADIPSDQKWMDVHRKGDHLYLTYPTKRTIANALWIAEIQRSNGWFYWPEAGNNWKVTTSKVTYDKVFLRASTPEWLCNLYPDVPKITPNNPEWNRTL